MSVGCNGVRVCGRELCSRYHVYKNLWERNCHAIGNGAVAVMRWSTIVCHVPRKISAACSLFLADQRHSNMSACAIAREVERRVRDPTHTHVMTRYRWNVIWQCVHNPPNCQIKFPVKFSGHTVAYNYPRSQVLGRGRRAPGIHCLCMRGSPGSRGELGNYCYTSPCCMAVHY